MTMCDVSEGAYSDKPAENYHPTAQFLSALQSFLFSVFQLFVLDFMATFLFWFTITTVIISLINIDKTL